MDYIRSMWTPPPASPNSSPEPPKTPVSRSESVKPTTARSNSSESTSSCKKKLTRAKLRENGIILDEKVSDIGLPDDVSKLKRHLLDIGQLRCHKEHAFDVSLLTCCTSSRSEYQLTGCVVKNWKWHRDPLHEN